MKSSAELLARAFCDISELLRTYAREQCDKQALVHAQDALTYGELDNLMDRVAMALQRDGVRQGDAVALVTGTTIQSTGVFFGILRAGGVATPIPPSSTPEQIAAMIADCNAPIVFTDVEAPAFETSPRIKVIELDKLGVWLPAGAISAVTTPIKQDDPFNIIYSSGTTGTPKGIVHTHGTRWVQNVSWKAAELSDGVTMVSTPIYSNTTLTTLLPTIVFGGTAVLLGKFDARQFLVVAEQQRATHAMLVPVQYQRIMAVPDFDHFDLSSFRLKTCTSAPFAPELKADVVRRWPGELLEIYGMTEGGASCLLYASEFPDKLHTVGQPAPGSDMRLIDEEGQEVRIGEIGEVVGRSAFMMTGYHGRADATDAATWFDSTGQRFIRHGDIGRFDEDGFLTLLGRSKDMIISGGFNIYPPDLEAVLLQHPGVVEVAVIGIPNERWGESPYAFFVPHDDSLSEDELLSWGNARLGKTQRLVGAATIDALPRSAIGKVLKRELRDLYQLQTIPKTA